MLALGGLWTRTIVWSAVGALALGAVSCGGSATPPGPSPTPTPPLDRPLPVSGEYTLTMSIGAGCRDLFPPELRVRTYEVDIVSEETHSRLRFANPAVFPAPNFACVCGRGRDGKSRLDLTFYEGRPDFNLLYEVYGKGALKAGTIRSQGSGRVSFVDESGDAVDCVTGDHSVALSPR